MKALPIILHKLANIEITDVNIVHSPHRNLQLKSDPTLGQLSVYRDAMGHYYQRVSAQLEDKVKMYYIKLDTEFSLFEKWDGKLMLIEEEDVDTIHMLNELDYAENTLWLRDLELKKRG